jgi:beta-glucanase (GH16 family)
LNAKKTALSLTLILCLFLNLLAAPFAPVGTVMAATLPIVDDFESGLPTGKDANNVSIGFNTFQDPNPATSVAISTTTTPPAPVPGASDPNHVLKLDLSVVAWAGFTHTFENAAVNTWVPQDWSAYEGLSFWLYGNNSGTNLFVDVLDNRNPDSIKDDAERWSITVVDNFSGWQEIKISFSDPNLKRKDVGNGAPNDGLGLTEVNGWALGSVATTSAQTYYVDNVKLYGTAPVKPLTVGFSTINYNVTEGNLATVKAKLSKAGVDPVTIQYKTTIGTAVTNRDYVPVAGLLTFPAGIKEQSFTVPTYNNLKYEGERSVVVELYNPSPGLALGTPPVARVNIQDNEIYSPYLLDDFESTPYLWSGDNNTTLTNPEIMVGGALALPGQGAYEHILQASQKSGTAGTFGRTFATGQDWSATDGLQFWYYGQNSGKNIQLSLTNTTPIVYQHLFIPLVSGNPDTQADVVRTQASNQASADRPSDWALVWSDEFNNPSGTGANSSVWDTLVGDGTAYGIPGWGNDELEYYTSGTTNAATNGQGQLEIVTDKADGSLMCYYGPCQYTSTRMQTRNRFEVAYGRVEARVKVPQGAGLWPAFWMLGTNIDQAPWPQSGEIDIMEVVGRLPNRVFGTLHGPGYSGGASYGKTLDLSKPVADDYHVFAVEWQPNKIVWYLDGNAYFTATPDDAFLQGKQWVFNHPFYLLLNTAIGGNFGGTVGAETTFPQTTSVDYVRVYQAKTRSTAFQASFADDFSGWKQISVPFTAFQGTDNQKPDLSAIHSLSFTVPAGMTSPVRLDQILLTGGKTQMDLPVTFDSPSVDYGLIGFGGAEDSTIVSDPTGGANRVAKVNKSATAELWAGTTITAPAALGFAHKVDFTATRTQMTVRTYSPDANIKVRLKVEDHTNGNVFVETDAMTTKANEWETLTFNFTAPDLTKTYDKASIFFNFGVTGATAGAKTYYFDDVAFPLAQMDLPVTFDAAGVDYGLIGFGGAEDSTIVSDPTDDANKVAKVNKSATAELWAGTTITAPAALGFAHKVAFTATRTKMTVRTYSPDANIKVRLKVEDHTNGNVFVETDAMTTKANEWETLTFNFTAPDPTKTYDKASIFFNFGVTGAVAGAKTYYFDDVAFPLAQMDLPVTFDTDGVDYGLIGFGGAEDSTIVSDPTGGANKVAKVNKSATAELWAGTTITAPAALGFANKVPFTETATKMTVRTYSPDANIKVRLKVEDHTNGNVFVETDVMTTKANEWETLTFNFTAPDLTKTYDKASIFFNFGVTGAVAGAKTYYFDDVAFESSVTKTQMDLPVTFDSPTVEYGLIGFGGADDSTIVTDPTGGTNQVAKAVKSATAETWAGTTITTPAQLGFANKVPFTATDKKMTVRTYSPDAGIKVRLKLEDHTNNTITVETEATTTVANAWETLTFDFANQANGTPALNLANNYDKASIFFNFGVSGATAGSAKTYYFDDVTFFVPVKAQMDLPVTFDSPDVAYGLIGFGGADDSTIVTDPTGGTNQVAKAVKSATAETWAGTTITAPAQLGFANKVPFTATDKKMTVRTYSPDAGIKVRLKLEDHTNNTITVETEATTTVANAWETLTFDFANQANGTSALNLANNYDKASIFFNFGVSGATAGSAKTYYFDDVAFVLP